MLIQYRDAYLWAAIDDVHRGMHEQLGSMLLVYHAERLGELLSLRRGHDGNEFRVLRAGTTGLEKKM